MYFTRVWKIILIPSSSYILRLMLYGASSKSWSPWSASTCTASFHHAHVGKAISFAALHFFLWYLMFHSSPLINILQWQWKRSRIAVMGSGVTDSRHSVVHSIAVFTCFPKWMSLVTFKSVSAASAVCFLPAATPPKPPDPVICLAHHNSGRGHYICSK